MNTLYNGKNSRLPTTSWINSHQRKPNIGRKSPLNKRYIATPSSAAVATSLGLGITIAVMLISLGGIIYQLWEEIPTITIYVNTDDLRSIVSLPELPGVNSVYYLKVKLGDTTLATYLLSSNLQHIHEDTFYWNDHFQYFYDQFRTSMTASEIDWEINSLRAEQTELYAEECMNQANIRLCIVRTLEGVIRHFDPSYTTPFGVYFFENDF